MIIHTLCRLQNDYDKINQIENQLDEYPDVEDPKVQHLIREQFPLWPLSQVLPGKRPSPVVNTNMNSNNVERQLIV